MGIRLLLVSRNVESLAILHSLVESASALTCFDISVADTTTQAAVLERVARGADDVVVLDWEMGQVDTLQLIRSILAYNPQMRVIVLLPSHQRQYREQVWAAGACNSIPKGYIDQEWLASVLCVMVRAMERETKLRLMYESNAALAVR